MTLIESSLVTWPMLRLDPEFMVSVIAVYAALGDPRAAILAEQMLKADHARRPAPPADHDPGQESS